MSIESSMVLTRYEGPALPLICRKQCNVGNSTVADQQMIEQLTREIQKMQKVLQDQNTCNEQFQGEIAFLHVQASHAADNRQ